VCLWTPRCGWQQFAPKTRRGVVLPRNAMICPVHNVLTHTGEKINGRGTPLSGGEEIEGSQAPGYLGLPRVTSGYFERALGYLGPPRVTSGYLGLPQGTLSGVLSLVILHLHTKISYKLQVSKTAPPTAPRSFLLCMPHLTLTPLV
jgi:hypothetical protein